MFKAINRNDTDIVWLKKVFDILSINIATPVNPLDN